MKKSELIAMIQADLEANGDTEHVALGFPIKKGDKYYRFDVYGEIDITNDVNYCNGMAYLVASDVDSAVVKNFIAEDISEEQQIARGSLLAQVLCLRKDPEHKDRFKTTWGTKTALGIFATVKRIVEEGK